MKFINKVIVSLVELMPKPIVRIFANKYIAGDTLQEGVSVVKDLNKRGIMATMDVLGEAIQNRDEAIDAYQKADEVLDVINREKLDANLSIKPTQFGLMLDEEFCYDLVKKLVVKAKEYNTFIRLDMEDSTTTDKIIALFLRLRSEFENVGIVIQACMRRSMDDIALMNAQGGHYRLCKGIYIEPEKIAFRGKQEVRDNYMALLHRILKDGRYVGIATHDSYLIDAAKKMLSDLGTQKGDYEFQMLLGVREDLRDQLNREGFRLRLYVPFGKDWYKYSVRRLKENPQIAWDIFKDIFSIR
ncbi:MAG: proline dehydrogenase family protein [Ignavibacteria bacterium]|nr:proline dehydrogenase family protein [Ignavibacteria bacterium]